MGSTRRSPPCSRSRTTGVLAGSSNRTPRSSISTTLAPYRPAPRRKHAPAGRSGPVEVPHEGVRIGPQGGQIGGRHEGQVAVALGVPEAVADDVVGLDGEADPPQRDGDHPAPDLVDERAHLDGAGAPAPELTEEVGG